MDIVRRTCPIDGADGERWSPPSQKWERLGPWTIA